MNIQTELFALQDEKYKTFHQKLIPTVSPDKIIGVRTPVLRKFAKTIAPSHEAAAFVTQLPHEYYEENNLHGELIKIFYKDIPSFLPRLEEFLPYVDNWATCDMLSPKVFKKDLPQIKKHIDKWLASSHTYTIRFAVVSLMNFYLTDAFTPDILSDVARITSDEYYIQMAIAWFFSVALIKQYDAAVPYIENRTLPPFTHKATIQKAVDSYRISPDTKIYLKSLR